MSTVSENVTRAARDDNRRLLNDPIPIGVSQRSGSLLKRRPVIAYRNAEGQEGQNDVFVRPPYAIGMARR